MNRSGFTDLDAALPAVVRDAMREHGVTLVAIADRLGVRRATLTRRMSGYIPFTVGMLAAVAEAAGTDLLTVISTSPARTEHAKASAA